MEPKMVTLPVFDMEKSVEVAHCAVDEEIAKRVSVVEPVVVGEAKTVMGANGEVVPTPMKPLVAMVVVLVVPKEALDAVSPPLKFRSVEVAFPGKRYAKLPVEQDCVVTLPLAVMVRHCPACVVRFEIASDVDVALVERSDVAKSAVDVALVATSEVAKRDVVVALVKERFVPDIAVVEAYGNCDAAIVDEEKKTPCVSIEEVVAEVLVPNELSEVNGYAKKVALVR